MVNSTDATTGGYRNRAYDLLDPEAEDGLAFYVNVFIMGLIVVNVAAVILETVDSIQGTYAYQLRLLEIVSVSLFTIEYAARLWTKIEEYDTSKPVASRLRAAQEPMLLVDLVAILRFISRRLGSELTSDSCDHFA